MPEIIVKLGDSIVQKYFFVNETMSIGRAPDNEIVIENLAVSRCHSVIKQEEGRYVVVDLGSANGTHVNGVRIKKTELIDRDVITLGKHKLFFYDQRSSQSNRQPSTADVDRTMLVQPTPRAELEVIKGRQKGERFELTGLQTHLGKGSANEIQLKDWFVSKQHAVIERRGNVFYIRDLGSWRHTFVAGQAIDEVRLKSGDLIQLGPTVQVTFSLDEDLAGADPSSSARIPIEMAAGGEAEAPSEAISPPPELAMEEVFGEGEGSAQPEAKIAPEPDQKEFDVLNPPDSLGDQGLDDGPDLAEDRSGGSLGEPERSDVDGVAAVGPSVSPPEDLPMGEDSAPELDPVAPPSEGAPEDPQLSQEVLLWEKALENKSPVIRKQAARRLKQLTERDYEH
jgi:pSer/pThr/pTyr-binding forkhead associated (FHA) protein